jgi:hypothetical protein
MAKDGTIYTGYFVDDKFEGLGRIICGDGDMYNYILHYYLIITKKKN